MKNNNKFRNMRRGIALGVSLGLTLANSPMPSVPQAGKECLSTRSIFGGLLTPGWNTPELLRAQIAAHPDLKELNCQLRDPKNWGVAAIEDFAQRHAPAKKVALESAMQDFLQKHGERLSGIRSLDTLLAVVFDPYNWHFRKYSKSELVRLIETAMRVGLYVNQDGMRAHPGGPFAHARRGITPDAQGQSREPVIWLGRGLFEHPEITDQDLALLLLEESQHILFYDRKHGEGAKEIGHSGNLVEKLRRVEGVPNFTENFCEADHVPSDEDSIKKKLQYLRERLKDKDRDVRATAVRAVGNLIASFTDEAIKREVLGYLREGLKDENWVVREVAVVVVRDLVESFTDEAIKREVLGDLRERLKDEDWTVRNVAIAVVGNHVARLTDEAIKREVLGDLRERLKDEVEHVRATAAGAVSEVAASFTDEAIKRKVLGDLRGWLKDEDERVRKVAVEAVWNLIARFTDEAIKRKVLGYLRVRIKDEAEAVRATADWAVGDLVASFTDEAIKRKVLGYLREWLKDDDERVRKVAVRAVGNLVASFTDEAIKREVLGDLRERLKDEDWTVRYDAVVVVGNLVARFTDEAIKREVLGDLRERLKDEDGRVQTAAFVAVRDIGASFTDEAIKREVLGDLREWLKDEEERVRKVAVRAVSDLIARFTDEKIKRKVLGYLRERLKDEATQVREAAVVAVGNLVASFTDEAIKREVLGDLRERLKDKAAQVREVAVVAVGNLVASFTDEAIKREVLGDLRERLKDKIWVVRDVAVRAVNLVASFTDEAIKREVLGDLRERLKDENWFVRNVAVRAVGNLVASFTDEAIKREVLGDLRERLKDEVEHVRTVAAKAIFILGTFSDNKKFKTECHATLEPHLNNPALVSSMFQQDTLLIISRSKAHFEKWLRLLLLAEFPSDEDPTTRWFFLAKIFAGFPTKGGKIHLNLSSEQDDRQLGFNTQDHSWLIDHSLECHFCLFTKPSILQKTIEILFRDEKIKKFVQELLISLPEEKRFLRLQPTLKVDQLFWDSKGNLREGARYLALGLLASAQWIAVSYADQASNQVDTYGPLVEGGDTPYEKEDSNNKDRSDLWEVAYLFPEDLEPADRIPESVRLFRQYHLIGKALLSLYRTEEKRSDLDRQLAPIAEEFVSKAHDLFTQAEVYEAITTSWKRGNWPVLKHLFEELNLRKTESRVSQERGIEVPKVRYGDQKYELRQAMGLLLRETELKVLDVVLQHFVEELNETCPAQDQLQLKKKVEKLVFAMAAMEHHIISGMDLEPLMENVFSFFGFSKGDEDASGEGEEGGEEDGENWLDFGPWQDPPQSPDMLQGKEIPHAERNAHLREQIHSGLIFSVFPITSTSSPRNASPNLPSPFASTRSLDEAV